MNRTADLTLYSWWSMRIFVASTRIAVRRRFDYHSADEKAFILSYIRVSLSTRRTPFHLSLNMCTCLSSRIMFVNGIWPMIREDWLLPFTYTDGKCKWVSFSFVHSFFSSPGILIIIYSFDPTLSLFIPIGVYVCHMVLTYHDARASERVSRRTRRSICICFYMYMYTYTYS